MSVDSFVSTSSDKRLATLAVLRAHWGAGEQTYTDTFLPFALEAVRLEGGPEVSIAAIQERMLAEFGIQIPHAALETVLRRARKKGLGTLQKHCFAPNVDLLPQYDTSAARVAAQREQSALIDHFVRFAEEEYELTIAPSEASDTIAAYLDTHATSLLQVAHGASDCWEPASVTESGAREFVLASFVSAVLDRDPEDWAYLERLVVGTMLSSALFTPDLERIEDPFKCDVYLDTPTLIDALGHGGEVPARAARESLSLLRQAGASINCFEHTAVEIERKLYDVAQNLRNGRRYAEGTHQIEHNAIRRKLSAEDLEQAAGQVRKSLRGLGVNCVVAPPHTERLNIDETAAERVLEERLEHSRKTSIRFDLDSLTAVYRLRSGRRQYRLESCGAIFATPHGKLVWAARQIFTTGTRNAPIAISLADLVTLAWLKRPRTAPDLPRLRIAADCYATIQPSAGLVRRYVEEAAKLRSSGVISDEDLYELRYGAESRRILMVKTKGSADAVNAEAIRDILEKRNRSIEARARVAADRDANAARAAEVSERERREQAEREAGELRLRLRHLEEATERHTSELSSVKNAERHGFAMRARRNASWTTRPVFAAVLIAVATVALFTLPWVGSHVAQPVGLRVLSTLPPGVAWATRALIVAVGVVVVILNVGWGCSVASVVRPIESRLAARLERRYLKRSLFGPALDRQN